MANEKVVYEIALEGVSNSVGQIAGLESKLSNIRFTGLIGINNELARTAALLNNLKISIPRFDQALSRRSSSPVGISKQNFIPNLLGFSGLPQKIMSVNGFSSPHTSQYRGNGFERIFYPNYVGSAPYDAFNTRTSDIFWNATLGIGNVINDIDERNKLAEENRRKNRRKWGKRNPWSDIPPWDIVPAGETRPEPRSQETSLSVLNRNHGIVNTGRVTDPGYIDVESQYVHYGKLPKQAKHNKDFGSKFRDTFFALTALGLRMRFLYFAWRPLIEISKKLYLAFKAVAEDGERLHRQSQTTNMTSGALSRQWFAARAYGDSAASASALMGRFATDRAMFRYGGDGGAAMEAARLFGLNIFGSSKYGLASGEELMKNINARMQFLDPEAQHALSSTLGLNEYQEHLVRQTPQEYNRVMLKGRTLRMDIKDALYDVFGMPEHEEGLYSDFNQAMSHEFWESYGQLSTSFHELMGVLGEAVLPILSLIFDILSYELQNISAVLEIVCKIIGAVASTLRKILEFMTFKWMDTNDDVEKSNNLKYNYYTDPNNETGTKSYSIVIENIDLNSMGLKQDSSPEEVKRGMGKVFTDILAQIDGGER